MKSAVIAACLLIATPAMSATARQSMQAYITSKTISGFTVEQLKVCGKYEPNDYDGIDNCLYDNFRPGMDADTKKFYKIEEYHRTRQLLDGNKPSDFYICRGDLYCLKAYRLQRKGE